MKELVNIGDQGDAVGLSGFTLLVIKLTELLTTGLS
jgi:hypothetical protein